MDSSMCLLKWLCTLALLTVILMKTAMGHADDFDELTATDMIMKINQAAHVDDSLLEGDIKLASDQDEPRAREKRAARRDRRYIWTGKTIPYEISYDLMRGGYEPNIKAAIQEIHAHSCLRWKPRESETRWISFQKLNGCWSYVGMSYFQEGGPQNISLGVGCNRAGIIIHEMLHASGFWHEQSRYDRDKYVKILWENIKPGKERNFRKYPLQVADTLNNSYDLASIMHYGRTSFSRNSQPTIQVIGDPSKTIGQRNGLSQIDIAQLNALYDCSGSNSGWSTWSAFGPCDSRCTSFRQRFCASNDTNNCPGADNYGVETQRENCIDQECDGPYDCEFETAALCNFTLCNKTSNLWRRYRGKTPSPGTGPMGDHTTGYGYYLYFEASSPAQPKQISCFFSEDFPGGLCQTLTFWYHMYGSGMGEFKVLLKDTAGTETTVWQKSGDQGDKWIQASIRIQRDSKYKVYFVGIRGDSFRSDIVIDDLSFKPCSTHPTTSLLTSTALPSASQSSTSIVAVSFSAPSNIFSASKSTSVPVPSISALLNKSASGSTSISSNISTSLSKNATVSTSISPSTTTSFSNSASVSTSIPLDITTSFSGSASVSTSIPPDITTSFSNRASVTTSIPSDITTSFSKSTSVSTSIPPDITTSFSKSVSVFTSIPPDITTSLSKNASVFTNISRGILTSISKGSSFTTSVSLRVWTPLNSSTPVSASVFPRNSTSLVTSSSASTSGFASSLTALSIIILITFAFHY